MGVSLSADLPDCRPRTTQSPTTQAGRVRHRPGRCSRTHQCSVHSGSRVDSHASLCGGCCPLPFFGMRASMQSSSIMHGAIHSNLSLRLAMASLEPSRSWCSSRWKRSGEGRSAGNCCMIGSVASLNAIILGYNSSPCPVAFRIDSFNVQKRAAAIVASAEQSSRSWNASLG